MADCDPGMAFPEQARGSDQHATPFHRTLYPPSRRLDHIARLREFLVQRPRRRHDGPRQEVAGCILDGARPVAAPLEW
jgi:hypothetical protein